MNGQGLQLPQAVNRLSISPSVPGLRIFVEGKLFLVYENVLFEAGEVASVKNTDFSSRELGFDSQHIQVWRSKGIFHHVGPRD